MSSWSIFLVFLFASGAAASSKMWVGTSVDHGVVTISEGEVLLVEANSPLDLLPGLVRATDVRWERPDIPETVTTRLTSTQAAYAFPGPGSLEFLNATVARLTRIPAHGIGVAVLRAGEALELDIAEGESIRFFQSSGQPGGGQISLAIWNSVPEDFYTIDLTRFMGMRIPGPARLRLSLAAREGASAAEVATIAWRRFGGPAANVSAAGVVEFGAGASLVIQQSDTLSDWTDWRYLADEAGEGARFYRIRIER